MKKLGFGFMRLPLTDASDYGSVDFELVKEMADRFMEKGFTYFDTAYVYHMGLSEVAVKKAVVERYPRDSFTVANKMPVFILKSEADYETIFQKQLERCGVDYFDYYMLHSITTERYELPFVKNYGFEFLKKLKAENKARQVGISFHDTADSLDRILSEHPEIDFVQLQINYMDWESEAIQSRKCYEVATKHGKPIIIMEPVKGGSLATVPEKAEALLKACQPELSPAAWAIGYAASLDNVFMVLSGMSNLDQLLDNISYMADFEPLSEKEQDVIKEVTGIINDSIAIPCTACRYCVEDCPKQIAIPEMFSLFNNQKQFGLIPAHASYYIGLTGDKGKASDCIGCKKCEGHCPQHIQIVDWMKEVATIFEPKNPT